MAATLIMREGQVVSTDAWCLNYDLLEGQYDLKIGGWGHPKYKLG